MVTPANGKPYPRATDYFVCPDIVQEVFGVQPKELRIMFPLDDEEKLFPQELKMYRSGGGLFCAGNGETARRWSDQGELVERSCPCEYLDGDKPQCKPTAVLNFLLPEVKQLGVWQLVCHGRTAIVSLNSALDHFTATFGGLRGIPFLLRLEQQETQRHDKVKGMVRQTIYVPTLTAPISYADVFNYRRSLGAKIEMMMLPGAPVADDSETIEEAQTVPIEDVQATQAMGPAVERTPAEGAWAPASPTMDKIKPLQQDINAAVKASMDRVVVGWTIEGLFLAAKGIGVDSTTYGLYLSALYGSVDNVTGQQIKTQGDALEQAEAGGKVGRDVLAQVIRLKANKRRVV
jgi:hypothetical protein